MALPIHIKSSQVGSRFHLLFFVLVCTSTVLLPHAAQAAGGDMVSRLFVVDRVEIKLEGNPISAEQDRKLRQFISIFPGRRYSNDEIDMSMARLRKAPGVASVNYSFDFSSANGGGTLIIEIREGAQAQQAQEDKLVVFQDESSWVKLRAGLKGATAVSMNQWFGNGAKLTEYNPNGQFTGGLGPNVVQDLAPSIGLSAVTSLGSDSNAAFLYGSLLYLGAGSVGQDNTRDDARWSSGWEEAFLGVVRGGTTENGSVWLANLSYGKQPYCIGNGLLLCQVASSGGDRAADFAWPRWSAKELLKGQFQWNEFALDAFKIQPNDAPFTDTVFNGINLDYNDRTGLSAGLTWMHAEDGTLKYYLPDGRSYDRKGLKVLNLRAAGTPVSNDGGLIWKLEYGEQTHDDFDMRANAYAGELGWQFADVMWKPSLSYRYSKLTGDNPSTPRYERWDLLYSGGDVDTWVQGLLMKNIQYNSNVIDNRVTFRFLPTPQTRGTVMFSNFKADTENNLGGVISKLAGKNLGNEFLLIGEYFASKNVYWRLSTGWLWPGSGVSNTLPEPVKKPWWVAIAQFNVSY